MIDNEKSINHKWAVKALVRGASHGSIFGEKPLIYLAELSPLIGGMLEIALRITSAV
jgi:hypothetical protein